MKLQDIDGGVEVIKELAEAGNSRAQSIMGNIYGSGFSVVASQPKALLNLHFAILDGDREGHLALGYRYSNGIGVPKNCPAALNHYSIVAADVAADAEVI